MGRDVKGYDKNDPKDVKAVYDPKTGVTSNYYGGQGRPDGPGHGHVDVDSSGNSTEVHGTGEPSKSS